MGRATMGIALAVLCVGCPNVDDTGFDDTGETGDTSDSDTDSGDTDSGDTDSGDTDSGDTDTADTGDTASEAANWGFEDWTTADPPPGFSKYPTGDWTVAESTDAADGDASAALTLTASATTRLLLSDAGVTLPGSGTYRFHAWVQDDDPDVATRLVVQSYHDETLLVTEQAAATSTDGADWTEYVLDLTVTASANLLRPRLRVEEVGTVPGSTVLTDAWAITSPVAFVPSDGAQDAGTVGIAGTPGTGMDVAAAINSAGTLYVSTNRADLDSDHLLFVWVGEPPDDTMIPPPWNKGGLVASVESGSLLAALVQERDVSKYCEWLVWSGSQWVNVAGSTCNSGDDGPRLEGTLPLPAAMGVTVGEVPRDLYVAVAPWESGDTLDGELKPEHQVPAGNGDTLLDPDEVTGASRIDLLVGRLLPTP